MEYTEEEFEEKLASLGIDINNNMSSGYIGFLYAELYKLEHE